MKRMLLILGIYILSKSNLLSQNTGSLNFIERGVRYEFFIPGSSASISAQYKDAWPQFKQGVVFKSPIKHEAVFCRLEDITQKKMRIVFQIHLGDYTSKMDMVVPR